MVIGECARLRALSPASEVAGEGVVGEAGGPGQETWVRFHLSVADGIVNVAFNYTIRATPVPTSFSASGLPAGLVLNSLTGAITGTNTTGGTFNATIVANNSTGSATNELTIAIYNGAASAPVITSALTATGSLSAKPVAEN